jgi:glycosyltransferase involved in cell wall biosynthesis
MDQKRRLLHVQSQSDLAGCERTCETFIRHTSEQFDSTVLLLNNTGPAVAKWQNQGADVLCKPIGNSRLRAYLKIYRTIRLTKPDLVILWTSIRLPLLSSACGSAGATKCAVHVGNPVRFNLSNRLASWCYGLLPHSHSARIIPASHHIAGSLLDKPSYQGREVYVCYNGIDLDQFSFKPKLALAKPPIVGMSARLDAIKDHRTLLTAWQEVSRQCPHATLELAGDGPLRNELEQLTAQLGTAGSVKFVGRLSDMVQRCRSWDLAVHSTTKEEGLGNSMIEAMALGRALVASDVGPVREVAGPDCALLVPPADPSALAQGILEALAYGQQTRARVNAARARVESKFSIKVMVDTYLKVLAQPS